MKGQGSKVMEVKCLYPFPLLHFVGTSTIWFDWWFRL